MLDYDNGDVMVDNTQYYNPPLYPCIFMDIVGIKTRNVIDLLKAFDEIIKLYG